MSEELQVVALAVGWSAGIGVLGLGLVWVARRQSLRWLLTLVAVVAVLAVIGAVLGTADAMFISVHDHAVVLWVSLAAGVVAVGFALAVGALLARGSRGIEEAARSFAESGEYVDEVVGPAEFARLSQELARTSDRLRESRQREQRVETSRRELVSWVSHDLRTPLAGLRAMTEALEDGLAPEPKRYHRLMRAEVDRMVRMVDDLFELSRIHAGTLQVALEPVELGDVVSEALAGADPVAREVGVRLGGEVDAGLVVRADAAGLSRVVANLVMNAIRHTPADGVVSIEGHRVAEGVELSVVDGCGGIPEEDLARVFEVAWRGSRARTPAREAAERGSALASGAGLGLAIVKGIVEAHEGRVVVRNEDQGCRFLVQLPA